MNIGVGVTTTVNRRDYLEKCLTNIHHYTDKLAQIYVYQDDDKRGIAYAKNMCLDNLKDNDYIFLFDDDCYPINSGWAEYYIGCLGQNNHLLFMSKVKHNPFAWSKDYKNIKFKDCGGVMMLFTKKVIETVGYMDSRYKLHGFEHAGYSYRIFNAGLNEHQYLCPTNADEYIYAKDYVENNVKSSLTNQEKAKYYRENQQLFIQETKQNNYKPFVK